MTHRAEFRESFQHQTRKQFRGKGTNGNHGKQLEIAKSQVGFVNNEDVNTGSGLEGGECRDVKHERVVETSQRSVEEDKEEHFSHDF